MANEKIEVIEETTVIENENNDLQVYYDEPSTSEGGGFGKVLLAIGGLAAAGTAAYLVKTKEKRKEKKLKKYADVLKAEGFVVLDDIIDEDVIDGEGVEIEEAETESEAEETETK